MVENRDYFMGKRRDNLKGENALVRYKSKQLIEMLKKAEPIQDFNIDLFIAY
jgi:site-specific DNA recombinase